MKCMEIKRHESGKGSVVEAFGHRLLVLDAAYRPIPARLCRDEPVFEYIDSRFNPHVDIQPLTNGYNVFDVKGQFEDSVILKDNKTGTQNTAAMASCTGKDCLASAVYNIIVDGRRASVPTIQQLMFLVYNHKTLDALDPTIEKYGSLQALLEDGEGFWSSTEYINGYYSWYVSGKEVYYEGKSGDRTTIPIIEL